MLMGAQEKGYRCVGKRRSRWYCQLVAVGVGVIVIVRLLAEVRAVLVG